MILGMKTRKHDLDDMLKFNPKLLEFHFSDSDLELNLDKNFDQQLVVHCYEYYERKLLDIVSLGETNQIHSQQTSLNLIQKAIDKTISLSTQFQGTPTIIVHPGGYSMNELEPSQIQTMKDNLVDAVKKLDCKNVNFLLENMPPYAWFFGGRWHSNVFLDASEMIAYSKETGYDVCFDICHSQMNCNKNNLSIIDELNVIGSVTNHFHLSDAGGVDEEGLQYGEGDIPFDQVIPILNKYNDKTFAIEVWKGHEQGGHGFKAFLDKAIENGLVVT
jgi:endonuclease IV|tara:strand:+ start:917 stop:1738 length:822 start_codon:yes stop_codon:yes gene_type:complete